jgi:hypothetical protein
MRDIYHISPIIIERYLKTGSRVDAGERFRARLDPLKKNT